MSGQTIQVGTETVRIVTTSAWDGANASQVVGGAIQEGTPTDFVHLPDGTGRFLVSTLGGTVHVLDRLGRIQTTGNPLLNPSQTGNTASFNLRRGLNSIALHPDFANVGTFGFGKVYGLASQDADQGTPDFSPAGIDANNHHSVLFEYDLSDLVGNASTNVVGPSFNRREIMRIAQDGGSHNAVDVAFRRNGELYLTVGDGTASSLNTTGYRKQYAQDLNEAFGKVLRFSPDPNAFLPAGGTVGIGRVSANGEYSISASNPFYDGSNADEDLDEIYANGVRSPYRITVDPRNEDVAWLGDVGEGNREEVNRIIPGGNYGWGVFEGTANAPSNGGVATIVGNAPRAPTFEYSHSNRASVRGQAGGGISVIGGFVYSGTELGATLKGKYIGGELGNYFDAGNNISRLFYGRTNVSGTQDPQLLLLDESSSLYDNLSFGGEYLPNLITSIGEDLNGELWVLGVDGTGAPGIDEGDGLPGQLIVARIRGVNAAADGDFDQDGSFDCADINRLAAEVVAGDDPLYFDLNGDERVDELDVNFWLVEAATANGLANPYLPGDGNLDGVVDISDFNVWNSSKFTQDPSWCSGDYDTDGFIDGSDFNVWNSHKFQTSGARVVPEPPGFVLPSLLVIFWYARTPAALARGEGGISGGSESNDA